MKKFVISFIIIIYVISLGQFVYADNEDDLEGKKSTSQDWVQNAFTAAHDFITKDKVQDDTGLINPVLEIFQNFVKGLNIILLTLLMGMSIISLSIIGIRYIASGASPNQRQIAQQSLHTAFMGMFIGFGAFAIWQVAMSIVKIIIESLAA